jgi:DNA-binding response OmpR family regulator
MLVPTGRGGSRSALAIGGDPEAQRSLESSLSVAGIGLVAAEDGTAGLRAFYASRPDVVILTLELVDIDGWEVLGTIRELSDVPVVAISTHDSESDRVRALRAGADDCIHTPIGRPEMLARIEALLRRPRAVVQRPAVLDDEFVHIDHRAHRAEVLGVEVALTPTEFRMLATFAEHPGRVLGHAQLLDMVWGDGARDANEVKLYVSYLRRKLDSAARIDPVETVRGVGYRYQPRRVGGVAKA